MRHTLLLTLDSSVRVQIDGKEWRPIKIKNYMVFLSKINCFSHPHRAYPFVVPAFRTLPYPAVGSSLRFRPTPTSTRNARPGQARVLLVAPPALGAHLSSFLLVLAFLASPYAGHPELLFLLASQSNMAGRGLAPYPLPAPFRPHSRVLHLAASRR